MQIVRLTHQTDFEGWRIAARALVAQGIAPENIEWKVGEENHGLFDTPDFVPASLSIQQLNLLQPEKSQSDQIKVPREFIELCRKAILHSDPTRFGLLYRLLWRLKQQPKLLQIAFDPDMAKIIAMVKAVRRDLHKMKAFVRFREIETEDGKSKFVAWFEPSHHIVEASAPFFTGRFTNMCWSILTPAICMHWDGVTLNYSQGASKADAPTEDAGEDLWLSYYRSIFNPARLKVSAMLAQMPKKYWRNLPEAPLIAELIVNSTQRMDSMITAQPSEPQRKIVKYIVKKAGTESASNITTELDMLNARMLASAEFPLAVHVTQAVPGTGIAPATIMLLGEQPGEQEDLAGQPFIGPEGKLLNQALEDAGIKRSEIYMTNVLKHYKFKLQGTRRVCMEPNAGDITIYLPWLQAEIAIVQPQVIIAMGTIAASAITGEMLDIEANRSKIFDLTDNHLKDGRQALVTYHPSLILRAEDKATQKLRYESLVADLKLAIMAV